MRRIFKFVDNQISKLINKTALLVDISAVNSQQEAILKSVVILFIVGSLLYLGKFIPSLPAPLSIMPILFMILLGFYVIWLTSQNDKEKY